MMKKLILTLILLAVIFLFGEKSKADPLIRYSYLTNLERSIFNETIWYWPHVYGPVHSNELQGTRWSHFYGQFSTSEDIDLGWDRRKFDLEPISNAPRVEFPMDFPHLRRMARPWIPTINNQLITWINMIGEDGIDIYQYFRGEPRNDSLVEHLEAPDNQVIYVDGETEIEGILSGRLTVYSAGDMYLLDSCIYEGADPENGQFDEDEMSHMLGLVSDRNIIIKDTEANGQENGSSNGGGNMDRHSIVVTAAMIALNESITFEHQNNEWDLYQGPEPDERGQFIVKGSMAQLRHGYVHRSNHRGTGYEKNYDWDSRFQRDGPPGLNGRERFIIEGRHDELRLEPQDDPYQIRNAEINSLIVASGVEIELIGQQPIIIRDNLEMRGTEDSPITVNPSMIGERTLFRVDRGQHSQIELSHVIFESNIETRISCDSLRVSNCEFNGPVFWEGITQVTNSVFRDEATLTGWQQLAVSNSVFEGGLTIAGNTSDGHLINNTFVKSRDSGLRLRGFRELEIVNNIIAFNEKGIHNSHFRVPNLAYNNVFGNEDGDYYYCVAGEGSISSDPLFVNIRSDDYHLTEGSPCINVGNPDSPPDPEGTRADIGAFYFHDPSPNSVKDNGKREKATTIELTGAFPNPFNSTTTIGYNLPVTSNVSIRVFDLSGRQLANLADGEVAAGSHQVEWKPDHLGAGVYLVQMRSGKFNTVTKIMLLK